MIKKNIGILLALVVAFINLTIMRANSDGLENFEQQGGGEKQIQAELNSFDSFYCYKNPNATVAGFLDDRSHSLTSVNNLKIPGSPDHLVHRFGEQLLIIPGNNDQSNLVCHPEPEKQKGDIKVVISKKASLYAEEETLFSKITKVVSSYTNSDIEGALKNEFWSEMLSILNEMQTTGNKGLGNDKAGIEIPDSQSSTHDFTWRGPFSRGRGNDRYSDDDPDNDTPFYGDENPFQQLFSPLKPGNSFIEDFGGFFFPKPKPEKKKKNAKRYITVASPAGSADSSSISAEVTANPVIENLTIIQFALLLGGFEIDGNLLWQLMNLDQLSAAELEQVASGFSATITHLDSLIQNNTVQISGLSNEQLVQLLLKIESLIQELAKLNEALNNPENTSDLQNIKRNLRDLITSRLISTIFGTDEIMVSKDASQHELLVRVLLDEDIDDRLEIDDAADLEELQDLVDEYIRRARTDISARELIRTLVAKIEAIQRQISRREENLRIAQGSWLRALENRLDLLRIELENAEQSLGSGIENYFNAPDLYSNYASGEAMASPTDDNGNKSKAGNEGGKGNTQPDNSGSSGQTPPAETPPNPGDQGQQPVKGEGDHDDSGDGNEPEGATASADWQSTINKRDMTIWFASQLRLFSLEPLERLGVSSGIAADLLLEIEKQPDKAAKIKGKIRDLFQEQYPKHLHLLPKEGSGERLDLYVLAILKVMRSVALANILFDVVEDKELEEIRRLYNAFKKHKLGPSFYGKTRLNLPDSAFWRVEATHNGEGFPSDSVRGHSVRDDISRALEQLDLSKLITEWEDGLIHVTEDNQQAFSSAFINHPDSGRTPVEFRFVRTFVLHQALHSTREYDLHSYGDLRTHLPTRFPADMLIAGRYNTDHEINSGLAQASQRGGIQDSIDLLLNRNQEAAALLHWLFSPNNSIIPLANMMFGGVSESGDIIGGILQQHGFPAFNPTSSDQTDLSSQNCQVTVYSHGRMSVVYRVSYDRISRQDANGLAQSYDANFDMKLQLDFDIRQSGRIKLLYKGFSFGSNISDRVKNKLATDIKKDDGIKDQKIIDDMKKLAERLEKYLGQYTHYPQNYSDINSVKSWRQYAVGDLKHALSEYHSLLVNIRTRKSLSGHPNFAKAKAELDRALSKTGLKGKLFEQVRSFPVAENRSYEKLSEASTQERKQFGHAVALFEAHRQEVKRCLERLQVIDSETRKLKINFIARLASRISELETMHKQLTLYYEQYDGRRGELYLSMQEIMKSSRNTDLPDLFDPVKTLISAAQMHTMELLMELDVIEKSVTPVESRGHTDTFETKPKHRSEKLKNKLPRFFHEKLTHESNNSDPARSEKLKKVKSFKGIFRSLPFTSSAAETRTKGSSSTPNTGLHESIRIEDDDGDESPIERGRARTRSVGEMGDLRVKKSLRGAGSVTDIRRDHLFKDDNDLLPSLGVTPFDFTAEFSKWFSPASGNSLNDGADLRRSKVHSSPLKRWATLRPQDYSMGSPHLTPNRSPDDSPESTFMRSKLNVEKKGNTASLSKGLTVGDYHQQHSFGVDSALDTIEHSLSPSSRRRNRMFSAEDRPRDMMDMDQSYPVGAHRRRSQLIDRNTNSIRRLNQAAVSHSAEQQTDSLSQLEELMDDGVPSQTLSEVIYDSLPLHGLTTTDFSSMLGIETSANDDYDYPDDWTGVQSAIQTYLLRGHTLDNFVDKLYYTFGTTYIQYINRAHSRQEMQRYYETAM